MNIIYSVAGCIKCRVVKNFMNDREISFAERDVNDEGKEDFKKFYAVNRKEIFRGTCGRVEFPVFSDGIHIRQGVGPVIAFLTSETKLDGFFSVGTLHGEWVNGIHLSHGNPSYAEEFLIVLRILKANSMKLQIDTDGKSSEILQKVLDEGLADTVITNVID